MRPAAYQTDNGRAPFEEWFAALDARRRRAVQRRLRAIEQNGHFGDRKNLRGSLNELRFRQAMRIYFAEIDGDVVLLLGGSGKRDQRREIIKARARLHDYKRRKD